MYRIISAVFILIILIGCSNSDDMSDYATTRQAIRKGTAANDDLYSGVVSIAIHTDNYIANYCTGTLITPDIVLTAAHCVSDTQDVPFNELFQAGHIAITVGEQLPRNGSKSPEAGTMMQNILLHRSTSSTSRQGN